MRLFVYAFKEYGKKFLRICFKLLLSERDRIFEKQNKKELQRRGKGSHFVYLKGGPPMAIPHRYLQ